ncbi:MAG: nickel-dependent hydrogenase, large subunit [Labilithrix sp.]|nr:nickel-dependent hydrogenase, large subunit [Labilithrix sp.]
MATRLTIDPVTRIEGHLRVDVQIDGGRVDDAWVSCTMWRGLEKILLKRDAREAWLYAQRFCGVCTTVHAMASVRAVEDALKLEIPLNAQAIRNLILIAHALHDHIVHFYQLSALDWIDVTTIPRADPAKAAAFAGSISSWRLNSVGEMARVRDRVTGLIGSGQLGIFAHGYWGHPAMHLPPEVNLALMAHYFHALEFQRKSNQVVAMLGGKTPHIQNLAVGGVMNAIDPDGQGAMNVDRLFQMKSLLDEVRDFAHQVYLPDACALAAAYPEAFHYGRGVDAYFSVPDLPTDAAATSFDLPGGILDSGDLKHVRPLVGERDAGFRAHVTEDVTHAWYRGSAGPEHPFQGSTEPDKTAVDFDKKYSWVKAPRLEGKPMQVGPLANVLVGWASGHELTKTWLGRASEGIGLSARPEALVGKMQSTMGRYVARAVRSAMLADLATKHWQLLADSVLGGNLETYRKPEFPSHAIEGLGLHEAPRGALSHWVVVEAGIIKNYQAVVPTTWNASPRDERGARGPYEASLVGTPIADPTKPLEVLRTLHSFDPCMACACHAFDPQRRPLATVRVL